MIGRDQLMTICILAPRFPYPENAGDVLRINNIARYLKVHGHRLILITYRGETGNNVAIPTNIPYDEIKTVTRNRFFSVLFAGLSFVIGRPLQIGYYFSFSFLFQLKRIMKTYKPDIYISHLIRMVPYIRILKLQDRSIIEMTDVLSKTYSLSRVSKRTSMKRILYRVELRNLQKYENIVARTFQKCVLVSEADREYLHNSKNVYVYKNGVSVIPKFSSIYKQNKIVFVGNMRTLQNMDAIEYFIIDILPYIEKWIPNVEVSIVGAEPPPALTKLIVGHNITITGYVDSVEEVIVGSAVAIAPVRIAAGVQNKVLVSMACGIPVVMTPIIATGIPECTSFVNCFIADSAMKFAKMTFDLLSNEQLRNKIALAGYTLVKENYLWGEKLDGYERLGGF
jgi:polysaccharide biosynthesis protein PslH